jgi:hypothetical protein
MTDPRAPNRAGFAQDPGSYASLAWMKWAIAQDLAGIPTDPEKPPSAMDLKNPVLWLAQAHALSEAAVTLIRREPEFGLMPHEIRGVCDSQYCAVALMLVGYSLEVCLKAMVIIREGVEAYTSMEKDYKHHRLSKLASFIPDLSTKDHAILEMLTHFVTWAGRYPDPGSGRVKNTEEIYTLSEAHEISARDLFELSGRVMSYVKRLVD